MYIPPIYGRLTACHMRSIYSIAQRRQRICFPRHIIHMGVASVVFALVTVSAVPSVSAFAPGIAPLAHPSTFLLATKRKSNDDIENFRRSFESSMLGSGNWRSMRAGLVKSEGQPPTDGAEETPFTSETYAHELHHVEEGSVLLVNERMGGKNYKSVLFVTSHDERQGTKAVGISRILDGNVETLTRDCTSISRELLSKYDALGSVPVVYGGSQSTYYPGDRYAITAIHNNALVEGSRQIIPGVHVDGNARALNKEVHRSLDLSPAEKSTCVLFAQGHHFFAPGQLDREIGQGIWYLAAVSPDFILHNTSARNVNVSDFLWDEIMCHLGGKYAEIACANIHGEVHKDEPVEDLESLKL